MCISCNGCWFYGFSNRWITQIIKRKPISWSKLYIQKRFYNRETNSAVFCVIQQTSLKPPYATQIIKLFFNSRILANHKGEGFQPMMKSLYPLLFLWCRISFQHTIVHWPNLEFMNILWNIDSTKNILEKFVHLVYKYLL